MEMPDFKGLATASKQVATYSAMNPILWKTVIVSPVAIICSTLSVAPLSYLLFGLATLPILVGAWGFVHFARKDPDRLQSEGHVVQMKVLSRMGTANENGPQEILIPNSKKTINNPIIQENSDD